MNTAQSSRRFVITSLLTLLVPIVLFAPQAYAETYVAGQFGYVAATGPEQWGSHPRPIKRTQHF